MVFVETGRDFLTPLMIMSVAIALTAIFALVSNKIFYRPRVRTDGSTYKNAGPNIIPFMVGIVLIVMGFMSSMVVNTNHDRAEAVAQIQTQVKKVYGVDVSDEQAMNLRRSPNDNYSVTDTVENDDYLYGSTELIVDGTRMNVQLIKDNGVFKLVDDDKPTNAELPKVKNGE